MRSFALFFLAATFCGQISCTNKSKKVGQKVILSVNGRELRAQDFADQLAAKLKDFDALAAKDPDVVARAKSEIVRNFIIDGMTEDWAKANSIFVRKEDLDSEISNIQKGYPDKTAFEQALADQNISFRQWKASVSNSLLHKLVIRKLMSDVSGPTDLDLRQYYNSNKDSFERPEQVKLRHILLATESDAKTIEGELKKGRSLSDLAAKFSISPEGKRQGDLGWVEKGVSEVFDTAFGMRAGQRSAIQKSAYGYHIFEVVAKRPSRTEPFESVKGQVRQLLIANREQAIYTAWLEDQLRKTRILKDEELISSITIQTKER